MIKRHHKISYLRKDLSRTSGCYWMAQLPGEMIDGFICSPAALASWISDVKPDLLTKPSLRVLILGSMLDGFDHGAWWGLFSVMLGKASDWATVTVVVHDDEGKISLSGAIPTSLAKHIRIVRGTLSAIDNIPGDAIDIVYLPFGYSDAWCPILGNEENNLWRFLDLNATLVVGLLDESDVSLCCQIANQYGLDVDARPNRFFGPTSESMAQAPMLLSAQGTKPLDLFTAHDHATNLAEVKGIIEELSTSHPGVEPEDYRLWGISSTIKSSVDSSDKYISLPRSFAVRISTGLIYRIEDDLAVGEQLRVGFAPETMSSYPGEGCHWTARVFWAGRGWEAGLGDYYNQTLGAAMDKMGVGMSHVSELIDKFGGSSEDSKRLKNAMTGGERYSPTGEERMLFDLVDRRDEQAVLSMVEQNRILLDSFNEDRLPLLVMLGLRRMPEAMAKVIQLGANPNARDGGERPILVELSGRSNRDAVQVLLNAGVKPNCQDALGWTPLLYALKSKRWDIAQLLLDAGADPRQTNSFGHSPITMALGEKNEMDLLSEKAIDVMKKLTEFDIMKTNAGFDISPGDIPQPIRDRILAYR